MKRFFRHASALALAGALAVQCAGTRAEKPKAAAPVRGPIRVFVVTGGHDFDVQPFFDMWKSFPDLAVTHGVQPLAQQRIRPGLGKSFDAVVFYDTMEEIDDGQKKAFLDLVAEGAGLVFLHHSLCSYQEWDAFSETIGGKYRMNPGTRFGSPVPASSYVEGVDLRLSVADPNHPVTAGLSEFTLRDEAYENIEVLPDAHPLLFADGPSAESGKTRDSRVAGWWMPAGPSRIVALEPGHDRNAFGDPNFRKLLYQSVEWVARRVPEAVPVEALTDWSRAGLGPGLPRHPKRILDITREPGADWDAKVASAVEKAKTGAKPAVVFFPAGTYRLTRPIVLDNPACGGVVFRGAGADSTVLEFQAGRDGVCFEMRGDTEGSSLRLGSDMPRRTRRIVAPGLSERFAPGDWVWLCESGFPDADPGNVGQITQIERTGGDTGFLADEANKEYLASNALWIRKLQPLREIGFEDFTLRRLDAKPSAQNLYPSGNNWRFDLTADCWIRNVSSENTCRHHVVINRSAGIEISGSTFADARSRDENSYGYGILLEVGTCNCLFENNAFRRLRHSMTICEGANGNVFALNYSRDQNWKFKKLPNPFRGADLCLHGRYPYANLFEQNEVKHVYADDSHGVNGPYNVFLRNLVYHGNNGKGMIRLFRAPETAVIGNLSTPERGAGVRYDKCEPFSDLFGFTREGRTGIGHNDFRSSKHRPEDAGLSVVSYFYRKRPDFLPERYTWPCIGPATEGVTPVQTIPAKDRLDAVLKDAGKTGRR
jgi:type 1 glutamine amidotransferase